jgi:hypothetical protein
LKLQTLKPGFRFAAARVETRRFRALWVNCKKNVYSPPTVWVFSPPRARTSRPAAAAAAAALLVLYTVPAVHARGVHARPGNAPVVAPHLHRRRVHLHGVAVQVQFQSISYKLGDHFLGSRVDQIRRFQAMGKLNSTCTAPPRSGGCREGPRPASRASSRRRRGNAPRLTGSPAPRRKPRLR